jgi:DNA-binding response OmpR family regulator
MKVLIVEDNAELAGNVNEYLRHEGYVCELAADFSQAIDKISSYEYDCIVLDLILPDGNGFDIVHYLRSHRKKTCILVVSAKNGLDDRIKGLELGADDYLTKPFHLSELNARLKAVFRRKFLQGDSEITFNEIQINTDTMEVRVGGQLLDLTRKEYALLLYFLTNQSRVLTRQTIAEHLWGDYADNLQNFDFVYQHIKNLRKKIVQASGKDYVETVYGLGYKFNTAGS